jgi:hypothetical protein
VELEKEVIGGALWALIGRETAGFYFDSTINIPRLHFWSDIE